MLDKRGTGLSDRIGHAATLEERMDDVRAVLDAVGSERAAVLGINDGGPMAILFAATYPDRCFALVLFQTRARWAWAPDYPWSPTREHLERMTERSVAVWGTDEHARPVVEALWPDRADDAELVRSLARLNRQSTSPGGWAALQRLNSEIDVRDVLPSVRVPTLVLERESAPEDAPHARYLVEHIPGARRVELAGPGAGLFGSADDVYRVLREFLDEASERGAFPSRTACSPRSSSPTSSTRPRRRLSSATAAGRSSSPRTTSASAASWRASAGASSTRPAMGSSPRSTGRRARSAARAPSATRSATSTSKIRAGLHTGECEVVDGKVTGIAVATGARVAALAGPGEVLVSATVRDLVAGSGLEFVDRGMHALKGLPEERRVYAVA